MSRAKRREGVKTDSLPLRGNTYTTSALGGDMEAPQTNMKWEREVAWTPYLISLPNAD